MLRNYFKIAFRNLWRNKLYSFINIAGLAMGIAAFILILQYVSFEKSVNGFHRNIATTYRLLNENPKGETWPQVEPGWAQKAKERFPEIKAYCRFEEGVGQGIVRRTTENAEPFRETNVGYAEGNFFEFFSFNLLEGNAAAFKKPNVVFLSKAAVKKYFGKDEPIGQSLILYNQFGKATYTVNGVYEIPVNSDIRYDMVFSLETLSNPANLNDNDWAQLDNLSSQYINTYFQINETADYKKLEQKLNTLRNELKKDKDGLVFRLQPFANVHLPASFSDNYQTTGNLKYVYILSIIAILILVIAWFNYINLSTANALKRANEVGVRKVVGASRGSLVLQFLGESVLVNMISFGLALLIVQLLQPLFNTIIEKELAFTSLLSTPAWVAGLGLLIVGSLLSGAYTAYSLSGFNPVETLKGKLVKTNKAVVLRKSLVVFQFSISIGLLLVTAFIYRQLNYMQHKSLGVNTDQLLVIRGPQVDKDSTYKQRRTAFINALAQQSFVKDYSLSGSVPGNGYNFATSGFSQPGSRKGDELKSFSFALIDDRYLNTYEIGLKAGRTFTQPETMVEWNDNDKVLMNEKAIEELGFKSAEEALNTKVQWDERKLQVIGVVKNYHHVGLQKAIDPIIFYPQSNSAYFTVRLQTDRIKDNVAQMETLFKSYFRNNPFEYFFADENFNKQYISEQQYSKLFTTASVWAIVIACLGLFALATYTVEARTKEIGVRKVLGANVFTIARLLSKDFLQLVFIAFVIAVPVVWYTMYRWLENFAYKVQLSWWVFAAAGIVAIGIALLTISFQAMKAAFANPVKSLRTE
ncbi:putative ABC transport system permease protein [Lacibacter cauensis]|uniref:Putative ABC transport system permease protein n=1 Tax=Lacibacter cauensis TaxID=510947 RepID=A0A562SDH9_9BACT|nr:ABC transporter permease [Lacibacter cauensis]TWI79351.1 putative ABC transport system permease protein [Lacibacter cauensis]